MSETRKLTLTLSEDTIDDAYERLEMAALDVNQTLTTYGETLTPEMRRFLERTAADWARAVNELWDAWTAAVGEQA